MLVWSAWTSTPAPACKLALAGMEGIWPKLIIQVMTLLINWDGNVWSGFDRWLRLGGWENEVWIGMEFYIHDNVLQVNVRQWKVFGQIHIFGHIHLVILIRSSEYSSYFYRPTSCYIENNFFHQFSPLPNDKFIRTFLLLKNINILISFIH